MRFQNSWLCLAAALVITGSAGCQISASTPEERTGAGIQNPKAEPGKPAPEFTLPDTKGQSRSLSAFKGKFVVLEWVNYDCPFVRKHYDSGNMQRLQKDSKQKGVVWLSINSSAPGKQGNFPAEEVNRLIKEKGAEPTAYLIDTDGRVGQTYGAKATPTMILIDPKGVLVYAGAIDDKPTTDKQDIAGAKNYVRLALDEAMGSKPVSISSTKAYGCSVKY